MCSIPGGGGERRGEEEKGKEEKEDDSAHFIEQRRRRRSLSTILLLPSLSLFLLQTGREGEAEVGNADGVQFSTNLFTACGFK